MKYQISINTINTTLIKYKYITLILFLILFLFLFVRGGYNFYYFLISFVCITTLLVSNNELNEDNMGGIAILQMIIIVLMVAAGLHIIKSREKYILLLNTASAFFASGSVYGFCISYKNKRK